MTLPDEKALTPEYWTAIETVDRGWQLRDCHASLDDAVKYAERQDMLHDAKRVVVMKVVADVHYAAALRGE